jgi:hypothetical protein
MFALVFTVGCGAKAVTVTPTTPEGQVLTTARVSVGGTLVGTGQVAVPRQPGSTVYVDGGPGWMPQSIQITRQTPKEVQVALMRDELYMSTVEDTNQVINRWLNLNVQPTVAQQGTWWPAIIAALTGQSFEMEMMDPNSGFVRTAWKERNFGYVIARRRFVGNIVSTQPLTWRVMYEVQIKSPQANDFEAYNRGFREELDALAEIRGRIEGGGSAQPVQQQPVQQQPVIQPVIQPAY